MSTFIFYLLMGGFLAFLFYLSFRTGDKDKKTKEN